MPRPPILKKVDWKQIFARGLNYSDWIAKAESEANRDKMEESKKKLTLGKPVEGYLKALDCEIKILAIAEDWCGDVVRHVPVLQKMVEFIPNTQVKFLSRDDSPEVFSRFLTNGGEAIPKFIFFNPNDVECGNWGPMPSNCREIIARGKACGDGKSAREKVSSLYNMDSNCRIVVEELLHLFDIASTSSL